MKQDKYKPSAWRSFLRALQQVLITKLLWMPVKKAVRPLKVAPGDDPANWGTDWFRHYE
jgi:hypothetical protein